MQAALRPQDRKYSSDTMEMLATLKRTHEEEDIGYPTRSEKSVQAVTAPCEFGSSKEQLMRPLKLRSPLRECPPNLISPEPLIEAAAGMIYCHKMAQRLEMKEMDTGRQTEIQEDAQKTEHLMAQEKPPVQAPFETPAESPAESHAESHGITLADTDKRPEEELQRTIQADIVQNETPTMITKEDTKKVAAENLISQIKDLEPSQETEKVSQVERVSAAVDFYNVVFNQVKARYLVRSSRRKILN
jgi:hypothetical protein